MIAFCAANDKYFNLYFDLWADQMNKFYPEIEKRIAVYEPTQSIKNRCADKKIICVPAMLEDHRDNDGNPYPNKMFMLRWRNLPLVDDLVLETQINCLPVKTQKFPKDNGGVEHLRLCRPKRGTLGGVSAAVFTPEACRKIVDVAKVMLYRAPENDHPMNMWQEENLSFKLVQAEQQFKKVKGELNPDTYWITAGTSRFWTPEEKLNILRHFANYKDE